MPRPTLFRITLLTLLTLVFLATWISTASAYADYSTNGSSGNCATCHGDFTAGQYTSLADGASWPDGLHNTHRNTMLGGGNPESCDVCHTSNLGRSPVLIGDSDGGTGLDPISCLGCHGLAEANGSVTGAGLRQHHFVNSLTVCLDCHADSDPGIFSPPGEDVLPPYYATTPNASYPDMPTDSCNPSGGENFAGTTIGLDNDGDNQYDQNDTNCQGTQPPPTQPPPTSPGGEINPGVNFLLLRTVPVPVP